MSKLHLLFTTDTHGHWLDRPQEAGSLQNTASEMQALTDQWHKEGDDVIKIDLGDFLQGSSFATYLKQEAGDGRAIARAFNVVGYNYQLLGNHEFNFGPEYRDQVLDEMKAQFLNANIVDAKTHDPIIGEPYQLIEWEGIRLGLIGVTTHYIPHWELPAHYEGVVFLDAFETAQKYARLIRDKVDIVGVLYHGGYERDLQSGEQTEGQTGENQGYRMLTEIPELDFLLTGHQHRSLVSVVEGKLTLQAGYGGEWLGHVEIEREEQNVIRLHGELVPVPTGEVDDTFYQALLPEIQEGDHWLHDVLGHAPIVSPTSDVFEARRNGHPFLELLNYLQLQETGADFSAAALINEHFSAFRGDITHETLLKAYPFYNLIAKTQVTGQELYEIMEFNYAYFDLDEDGQLIVHPSYLQPKPRHYNFDLYSGLEIHVNMQKPSGQRITLLVDERTGEPIDRKKTYTLALSQYRAVGGGDYHWLTQDKILSIGEEDIASQLASRLAEIGPEAWEQINEAYRHVIWETTE